MKTMRIGLVALFAFSGSLGSELAHSQQAEFTIDRCRSDVNVWEKTPAEWTAYMNAERARLLGGNQVKNNTDVNRLSYPEVVDRVYEMGTCVEIDPAQEIRYMNATNDYGRIMHSRQSAFIRRHNLLPQLLAEDAQGAR